MTAVTMSSVRTVRLRVADLAVALAAADVTEIARRPRMIRVPHGPSRLAGLANLRGVAIPIFALAGLLGRSDGGEGAWVVVLNRSPALGLLVDRVDDVSDSDEIAPGFLTVDDGGDVRSVALNELLAGQSTALQARSAAQLPTMPDAAPALREGASVGLLSFTLAGQNYALPLTDIVEVAPLPARVRKGPGASLGKMTIRDRKIELVSLRALLGLGDATMAGGAQAGQRVIVVDVDGRRTGLVVDGARAILRAPEASIGAPPVLLNRDSDATRIHSVMRMADGRGVVSVLTVASLFQGGEARGEKAAASLPEAKDIAEETSRFVIFHLGGEAYGYPIEQIGEIVRPPETMTRVPGAPDYVAGAVNLRGNVVPILNQRQRFGAADAGGDSDGRILVVDIAGTRTGLLVDRVSEIRQVVADEIGAAPELSDGTRPLFDRVITPQQDQNMILIVNPEMLLSRTEHEQLAVISGVGETARL